METTNFGTVARFGELKPGDFFVSDWNDDVAFGIAARFRDSEGLICVTLDGEFEVSSLADFTPVWKFDSAVVQPKVNCGGLKLQNKIATGLMVLASNEMYLICKDARRGSILYLNLATGHIGSPADPRIMVANWEIQMKDSRTNKWLTIYDRTINEKTS